MIIDAISEISASSGADGIQASFWKKCAIDLAVPLQILVSVYSPFSDRVGLPLHNTPFPGVLMKSIGAAFFTTECPS